MPVRRRKSGDSGQARLVMAPGTISRTATCCPSRTPSVERSATVLAAHTAPRIPCKLNGDAVINTDRINSCGTTLPALRRDRDKHGIVRSHGRCREASRKGPEDGVGVEVSHRAPARPARGEARHARPRYRHVSGGAWHAVVEKEECGCTPRQRLAPDLPCRHRAFSVPTAGRPRRVGGRVGSDAGPRGACPGGVDVKNLGVCDDREHLCGAASGQGPESVAGVRGLQPPPWSPPFVPSHLCEQRRVAHVEAENQRR
jgi:hypothetical protein